MSNMALEVAWLMDMLPEPEQRFAYELIKKLVRAWDPDYTKTTPMEAMEIAQAEESGFVDESEIDWNNLSKYAQ